RRGSTGPSRKKRLPSRLLPDFWLTNPTPSLPGSAGQSLATHYSGDGGAGPIPPHSCGRVQPGFRKPDWKIQMAKVLVSDKLSPTAVQIFKDNGVEVDYLPDLGKDKEKLLEVIGQ